MTRAEEQARKAYPDNPYYGGRSAQKLFAEGYEQAMQDFMSKAKEWFTNNLPSEKVQLLWCEFEQFIKEN